MATKKKTRNKTESVVDVEEPTVDVEEPTVDVEEPTVDGEVLDEEAGVSDLVLSMDAAEVEKILDAGDADDEDTILDITMRELKMAIRTGQFDEAEIASLVTEGVITAEVAEVLQAFPIDGGPVEDPVEGDEKPAAKGKGSGEKKAKKDSVSGQVTDKIKALLEAAPTGLTIEEICVELGILTADADPTDAGTKATKKRYRTFARKAVDGHPEGSREVNLGRNKLYSIGEVTDRELEETVDEPEDDS